MGKPVEKQNHSLPFFILSMLIAACTAWAFYDEFFTRRPWKDYQTQIFALEKEKAQLDLAHHERRLATGKLQVAVDPAKPGELLSLTEASKRLAELEQDLASRSGEVAAAKASIGRANREFDQAERQLRDLKAQDDGLFYEAQRAEQQAGLARAEEHRHQAAGEEAEAKKAAALATRHLEAQRAAQDARGKKREEIVAAEAALEAAKSALTQAEGAYERLAGPRDRLKAILEGETEPLLAAQRALEAAQKRDTALAQYWLTSYDGTVDRCQSCHASTDRCGYSRPHEVLAALEIAPEKLQETLAEHCITQETLDAYRAVSSAVCRLQWKAKGASAAMRCLSGGEKERALALLRDHCGPGSEGAAQLEKVSADSACLEAKEWGSVAAAYLEDPLQRAGEAGSWSVCEVPLAAEGDRCLEGAQRDQLLAWLRRRCPESAPALRAAGGNGSRACASGAAAEHLASIKPVLFEAPNWAQTHPHRSALLGNTHPPEKFGCTSCHEGQGAQTKGVGRQPFQHGHDDPYWERPLLDLVSFRRFRPDSFGPPALGQEVKGEWARHQEQLVQSSCARCHEEESSLPFAETYSRGRTLAFELGCQGCHPVDALASRRKPGPSLLDLRQKTTPEFLTRWLTYPAGFRPRTRMPNFWPEALDVEHRLREGSAEAKTRAVEVEQLAAFLWKIASAEELPAPPVKGDATRGLGLVQQVGCRACHTFGPAQAFCTPAQLAKAEGAGLQARCEPARFLTGSAGRDFAPNLSNIGLKANERWLFAWLKDPAKLWKDTRMPSLRLSDQEAADIAAYLLTLREGTPLGEPLPLFSDPGSKPFAEAAEAGSRLVLRYGCSGCHDIAGHEADVKVGAELNDFGRKTVDLFDFGNAVPDPRQRSWYSFVDLKLRAPHALRYERVDTRMPQYDLSDAEVEALMVFLKSRKVEKVPEPYRVAANERLASAARGERVQEQFNCKGCHLIDGKGGALRDIYSEDELWKAPPVLQAEGWRVQPAWLFDFLKDPSQNLRPWLSVRMPTFPLDDHEATALVRGFAADAKVSYPYLSIDVQRPTGKQLQETEALVAELRCFSCHTLGQLPLDQDKASLAPDLTLAKQRLRPDWVTRWIEDPQSLQEGTRMPAYFTTEDLATPLYPTHFGGSQRRQIDALSAYFMTLPDAAKASAKR